MTTYGFHFYSHIHHLSAEASNFHKPPAHCKTELTIQEMRKGVNTVLRQTFVIANKDIMDDISVNHHETLKNCPPVNYSNQKVYNVLDCRDRLGMSIHTITYNIGPFSYFMIQILIYTYFYQFITYLIDFEWSYIQSPNEDNQYWAMTVMVLAKWNNRGTGKQYQISKWDHAQICSWSQPVLSNEGN